MMKYERLTRKDERGFYHYNCTEKDQEDCLLYENCGECYGTPVLYRLAELEDKIEQGTLLEFPRIDRYVDYCYGLEKYVVQWQVNGIIKRKTFWNEKKAEKRLLELQGKTKL